MRVNRKLAAAVLFGAALGVAGTQALHALPEIKRNVVEHADLTGTPNTEVYMTVIDAPPGSVFAPHIHHGDEFTYVLQGSLELDVAGQETRTVKAGDAIHVNREIVHSARIAGDAPAKLLAVHVVDKGKPLSEAAK